MSIALTLFPLFLASLVFFEVKILFIAFLTLLYIIFFSSFLNKKLSLFLLILSRPILDYYTGDSIFSFININLASLWGASAILLGAITLIENKKNIKNIVLKIRFYFYYFL